MRSAPLDLFASARPRMREQTAYPADAHPRRPPRKQLMQLCARHLLRMLPLATGCAGDRPARGLTASSQAHVTASSGQAPAVLTGADGHFNVVYVDPRLLALSSPDQRVRARKIARRILSENPGAAHARGVAVEFTNQEDPRPPKRAVRFFFSRAQLAADSPPAPPVPERSTTETHWSSSHRGQRQ